MQAHSGPLPPAAEMRRYKEAHPKAPDVILEAFKSQYRHRQQLEVQESEAARKLQGRGQWMSFVLGVGAIAAGTGTALAGSLSTARPCL